MIKILYTYILTRNNIYIYNNKNYNYNKNKYNSKFKN